MYVGVNFDYEKIIKKANRIDKKIDFKSNNVKKTKKSIFSTLNVGFVLACIIGIGLYYEIMADELKLGTAILIFLLITILGSIYSIIIVSKKMKFFSYFTLKRISKEEYEIYEYRADIQSIYQAETLVTRNSLDYPISWTGIRKNGNVMIIDNQKIYLSRDVFEEIKFDKQITLYIAKYQNLCVLFDFRRILNENSIQNYVKEKNNIPAIVIVVIIVFIIMILLLPILLN